mgnify:CR=1 FL=1
MTFFKSTNPDKMAAAWLYAQFVTSKSVSLKKSITGLTFMVCVLLFRRGIVGEIAHRFRRRG